MAQTHTTLARFVNMYNLWHNKTVEMNRTVQFGPARNNEKKCHFIMVEKKPAKQTIQIIDIEIYRGQKSMNL